MLSVLEVAGSESPSTRRGVLFLGGVYECRSSWRIERNHPHVRSGASLILPFRGGGGGVGGLYPGSVRTSALVFVCYMPIESNHGGGRFRRDHSPL